MIKLLGIWGVKGSGKTTVGKLLERNHGYRMSSFAEPIKQMAKLAFPMLTEHDLFGPSSARERELGVYLRGLDPKTGERMELIRGGSVQEDYWETKDGVSYGPYLTPRLICQTLGTEWGRRLDKDIWVRNLLSNIWMGADPANPSHTVRVVITDCRFENEIHAIQHCGGSVIRLLRGMRQDGDPLKRTSAADRHPSELGCLIPDSEFDYVLDNNVSLEQLPYSVSDAVCTLEPKSTMRSGPKF